MRRRTGLFVEAQVGRHILVDFRPGAGLRVSPHFYTRADELGRFAEVLSELRERRSWTKHADKVAAY